MTEPRTIEDLAPGDTAYIPSWSVWAKNLPPLETEVYEECRPHSSVSVSVQLDGSLTIDREAWATLAAGGKATRPMRHDERAEVGRLAHKAILALLDHNLALVRGHLNAIKVLVKEEE